MGAKNEAPHILHLHHFYPYGHHLISTEIKTANIRRLTIDRFCFLFCHRKRFKKYFLVNLFHISLKETTNQLHSHARRLLKTCPRRCRAHALKARNMSSQWTCWQVTFIYEVSCGSAPYRKKKFRKNSIRDGKFHWKIVSLWALLNSSFEDIFKKKNRADINLFSIILLVWHPFWCILSTKETTCGSFLN